MSKDATKRQRMEEVMAKRGFEVRRSERAVDAPEEFQKNGPEYIRSGGDLKIEPNKEGKFEPYRVLANLQKYGVITKLENKIYSDAGFLTKFPVGTRATKEEIAQWMEENGPTAQLHSYGMEGKVSEAKKEYDRMTHEWYEKLTTQQKNKVLAGKIPEGTDAQVADKYIKLREEVMSEIVKPLPRATSAYSHVSALDTTQPMPEWTKTKSGKNVQRVDVVIPVAKPKEEWAVTDKYGRWLTIHDSKEAAEKARRPETTIQETSKQRERHLWSPDNLHENLPNTLGWAMIQYKTGPNGEKIAMIAEAQSRWGQERRTYENYKVKQNDMGYYAEWKDGSSSPWYKTEEELRRKIADGTYMPAGKTAVQDNPLLEDYNRLILKAAINQAKKEGATHIMVSDAETAMMTEGHDRNITPGGVIVSNRNWTDLPGAIELARSKNRGFPTTTHRTDGSIKIETNDPDWIEFFRKNDIIKEILPDEPISQEKGMRLNYDEILPNIAKQLTGAEGERLSLGEHKNAFEYNRDNDVSFTGQGNLILRSNLIFKNPDGTPKTDITGLLFPIESIPDRPPKLYGSRYSEQAVDDQFKHVPLSLSPEVSRVARDYGTSGNVGAKAATKFYNLKDYLGGKFRELLARVPIVENLTEAQSNTLSKYLWEKHHFGSSKVVLDGKQKRIAAQLTGSTSAAMQQIADEFRKSGVRTYLGDDYTKIFTNPNYWPNMPSSEAAAAIARGDEKVKNLIVDFWLRKDAWMIEKNLKPAKDALTPTEALKLYNEYKRGIAFRGRDLTTNLEFGPLKKAAGYGLPIEVIDRDVASTANRYANRASAAIAFHQAIANDPEAGYVLNIKNAAGEHHEPIEGLEQIDDKPEVQKMMKGVYGFNDAYEHPNIYAASRLAKNLFLGTPTAIRNQIQMPNSIAPYLSRISDAGVAMGKLFGDFKGLQQRAYEAGSIRRDYRRFDVSDTEFEPAMNAFQKFASKASDALRKYSGRNLSDHVEGLIYHAIGETLAGRELSKGGGEFSKKFGTLTDGKVTSQEDIQKIAQEFVSTVRGSYDARSLPSFALRGQLAPFFSLSQWSISKANTHYRDLAQEATKGNYGPMFRTVMAAFGVGLTIEQANEWLNAGKRPQDATVKEALASKNPTEVAEKVADLMQLAGFMGIMSDLGKLGIRASRGKDIKYSNPLSYPGYTFVTDTIGRNVANASGAINDGEDPFDVFQKLIVKIGIDSVQSLRMVKNWTQSDEIQRKNAFRDYRVWQEMTGRRDPEAIPASNEFQGMRAKEFKREKNLNKAGEMAKELIAETAKKSGNNINKLRTGFQNLKRNSYQTMPAPETMPQNFGEFYNYLKATQGEEAANRRVEDFMQTRAINRIKNRMVPSL